MMTRFNDTTAPSPRATRRDILRRTAWGAGLGLAAGLGKPARCDERNGKPEKELQLDVAGREQEIIDKAYRLGHQYEKEYGGCSQCTLAALQDAIPFLAADEGVFRSASCLDGGATPNGLQNCGSFTGAAMAIGYLCGRRRAAKFEGTTKQSHELVRKLYKRYEERYGSVLCKDVREKAEHDCPEVVGLAAKWTARILLDAMKDRGETGAGPIKEPQNNSLTK